MKNVMEMTKELTEILKTEIEDIYSASGSIKNLSQAIEAGKYLEKEISGAEIGANPFFCGIGTEMLKKSYNSLCDKFPEVEKAVTSKYTLNKIQ